MGRKVGFFYIGARVFGVLVVFVRCGGVIFIYVFSEDFGVRVE